jgi:hypothetical protein
MQHVCEPLYGSIVVKGLVGCSEPSRLSDYALVTFYFFHSAKQLGLAAMSVPAASISSNDVSEDMKLLVTALIGFL